MGLIDLLRRAPETETRSIVPSMPWEDYVSMAAGSGGGTVDQALKNAASWACIDVIADAYSRTPFDAVRKQGTARIPIEPAPKIVTDPSGVVGSDVWLTQIATSILTDGNAFGIVVGQDRGGYPTQIELVDPGVVTERRVVDGRWTVKVEGGTAEDLFPVGRVWHVPGRMVLAGSPFGLSPIRYASKTIGTTLAVEDFSNRFFTDSGHPTYAATSDQALTEDQAKGIKAAIVRSMRPGNREPLVIGAGLKLTPMQIPIGETQFIELSRFCIEQACRFWRVPPGMVYLAMSGQNITYANVTQNDLQLLKYTLEGYYRRLESAWSRCLPRPQVVKANRDAVLAPDPKTRAEVNAIRLRSRTTTVNEVRAKDDLAPFGPEFDVPGIPPLATGVAP